MAEKKENQEITVHRPENSEQGFRQGQRDYSRDSRSAFDFAGQQAQFPMFVSPFPAPDISMKDYVDTKHESALTKIDAAVVRVMGEIKLKAGRLDVWLSSVAIVGSLLATLAFAGDRFDGGIGLSGTVGTTVAAGLADQKISNADQLRMINELAKQNAQLSQQTVLIQENLDATNQNLTILKKELDEQLQELKEPRVTYFPSFNPEK